MNIAKLLKWREILPHGTSRAAMENAMEDAFVSGYMSKYDHPLPNSVSSTIAIAISCDGRTVATTHGDHTVKVFIFRSGEQLRVFRGHPRTPWTIKYHPKDPNIIASGCLGFQVRIWNIATDSCVNLVRFDYSIISIAFHPEGQYLAVASGASIEVWDWNNENGLNTSGVLTRTDGKKKFRKVAHSRNIRAVIFHPAGDYILAAAPDMPKLPSEMLTHCRLYAFKFTELLIDDSDPSEKGKDIIKNDSTLPGYRGNSRAVRRSRGYQRTRGEDENDDPLVPPFELSPANIIMPQIHLYSDGGLDISQDGQYLLTCAQVHIAPTSSAGDKIDLKNNHEIRCNSPISHPERWSDDQSFDLLTFMEQRKIRMQSLFTDGGNIDVSSASMVDSQHPIPPEHKGSNGNDSNIAPFFTPIRPPAPSASGVSSDGMKTLMDQVKSSLMSDEDIGAPMNLNRSRIPGVMRSGSAGDIAPQTAHENSLMRSLMANSNNLSVLPPPIPLEALQASGHNRNSGSDAYLSPRYFSSSVLNQIRSDGDESGYYSPGGRYHQGLRRMAPAGIKGHSIDCLNSATDYMSMLAADVASLSLSASQVQQHRMGTYSKRRNRRKCSTELQAIHDYINRASHRCVYPQAQYRCKRRRRSTLPLVQSDSAIRNILASDGSNEGDCDTCLGPLVTKHVYNDSSAPCTSAPHRGCSVAIDDDDDGASSSEDSESHSEGCDRPPRIMIGSRRAGWSSEDHLCVVRLDFVDGKLHRPTLVNSKYLPGSLMKAITSTKLSSTCRYALVGYGVRVHGDVQDHSHRHAACEVLSVGASLGPMQSINIMSDAEDEVNIAQFHPSPGHGIIYGTKRGKIRSFLKSPLSTSS